jgi:NAD+ kinase
MLVAIYNRNFTIENVSAIKVLFEELKKVEAEIILFAQLVDKFRTVIDLPPRYRTFDAQQPLPPETDVLISLGGDGTILDAVTYVVQHNIPILGINLGRLGFLANVSAQEVPMAVECLISEAYTKDVRTLLHLDSNKPLFETANFAINDFTIQRKDSSQLIKIHTYLNGEFICTYWADGLIVSTPTGSTGYSLSCGGPVLVPQATSFVVTPVAPHNLNVRSLVVPDSSIISFEIEGRAKEYLCTLDARASAIDTTYSIAISKSKYTVSLLRMEGHNFPNTIRQKLLWGVDRRN